MPKNVESQPNPEGEPEESFDSEEKAKKLAIDYLKEELQVRKRSVKNWQSKIIEDISYDTKGFDTAEWSRKDHVLLVAAAKNHLFFEKTSLSGSVYQYFLEECDSLKNAVESISSMEDKENWGEALKKMEDKLQEAQEVIEAIEATEGFKHYKKK